MVLKRFSVKEVVTQNGQRRPRGRELGSVVVVEALFIKIILEVISELDMMATLFRGELNSWRLFTSWTKAEMDKGKPNGRWVVLRWLMTSSSRSSLRLPSNPN